MVITNQLKNQHLLWRAGFGPKTGDRPEELSGHEQFQKMVKASAGQINSLQVGGNMFGGLQLGFADGSQMQKLSFSAEQARSKRRQSQLELRNLNLLWLEEMVTSQAQLREKMALFWHGHFASRNFNIYYQQLLLDIIRRHALGNFQDLLREVSKSAAMINFLNNNQNKKDHPNENFAREVMELFTMGRGHYNEQDVKEAARAFTGWGADLQGEFVFRRFQHDGGLKTILGRTGHFDGDDVLQILLEQKETARFITFKVYRFLVGEHIDQDRINRLAERFYQSQYNMEVLLEDILTADWFYDPAIIGCRVKSPVELIVGIRRTLPMELENPQAQLLLQKLLGQVLFNPPNVAGWPGGLNWIDSSTLIFRMRIPQILLASEEFHLSPKQEDDQQMGSPEADFGLEAGATGGLRPRQMIRAKILWEKYLRQFDQVDSEHLTGSLEAALLQLPSNVSSRTLDRYVDRSSREQLIKTVSLQLMSTPAYQLC